MRFLGGQNAAPASIYIHSGLGATESYIESFFGSFVMQTAFAPTGLVKGAGLRIGADGNPAKNCRLSNVEIILGGSTAQYVIVYGNDTPWTLKVANAWYAGGDMTITAPNCGLTAVTLALPSGLSAVDAALDLSGNDLTTSTVADLLATIAPLEANASAVLDMTGGTNAAVTTSLGMESLVQAAAQGWAISVNAVSPVHVAGAADADLNGDYEINESGEYVHTVNANCKIVWAFSAAAGSDVFVLQKDAAEVEMALNLISIEWFASPGITPTDTVTTVGS